MRPPRIVVAAILGASFWAAAIPGDAQPVIEQFEFDPPQLCLRDVFRWGFSYRGIPGGLAAVKDLAMEGVFQGRTVRSPLTPTRDDLERYTPDEGRFESVRFRW